MRESAPVQWEVNAAPPRTAVVRLTWATSHFFHLIAHKHIFLLKHSPSHYLRPRKLYVATPMADKPKGDSMSAPSIPNLLSLRGSRGGARGGRGRGRGGHSSAAASHDATIQGTDTDAAVSRLSAVDLGYLDDPYARYFVQSVDGPPARRLPIINRGVLDNERMNEPGLVLTWG